MTCSITQISKLQVIHFLELLDLASFFLLQFFLLLRNCGAETAHSTFIILVLVELRETGDGFSAHQSSLREEINLYFLLFLVITFL